MSNTKELAINRHNFEEAKNQLKKFSEKTIKDFHLQKVDSEKGLSEFFGDVFSLRGFGTEHTVKGSELNSLTKKIQGYLIDINDMHKKFIDEIGYVYSALDSLDKDYIGAIIISIKSAQKANDEVKNAQNDIEKTIEEQKKIIKVLRQFKEKIDGFKHITDIDKMWSEFKAYQKDTADIKNSLLSLEKHKDCVDEIQHLVDVDKIWSDTQQQAKNIESINKKHATINTTLEQQSESISKLFSAKKIIDSLEHISEVDNLWNDMQIISKTINLLDKNIATITSELDKQSRIVNANEEIIAKITNQKFIYSIDETKELVDLTIKKINDLTIQYSSISENLDNALITINEIKSITHLFDTDAMYDEIQLFKKTINNFNEMQDSLIAENKKLSSEIEEIRKIFIKKTIIAYALAGSSLCLIIIEFFLRAKGLI